jgi:biotin synthase
MDQQLAKIFALVDENTLLTQADVCYLLQLKDADLAALYQKADLVRKQNTGDEIFLRGIIEFSNHCHKNCAYCGIRSQNKDVQRYRISNSEILATCKKIEKYQQTTVVLQSGEDAFYTTEILGELISQIKQQTKLAVTLSVGERDRKTYRYWQQKGMDRYLLRFETTNAALFQAVHPDDNFQERLACIYNLKDLGVQTGSGFLIGLPNETLAQLADDILFCSTLNLEMIGVGPFIPHHNTPLGNAKNPFDKEIFFKTIAILRLLNKKAHIPATTAFDAIDPNGRNKLLTIGANVFMPNSSPKEYRKHYLLYPGKPCVDESSDDCAGCVLARINALNRQIGTGPGHAL